MVELKKRLQFKVKYNHRYGLTAMYHLKYPDEELSDVDELEDDELVDVLQTPSASSQPAKGVKDGAEGKGSTKK